MHIKKINLKDKAIRAKYSLLLQNFENEFDYPLGDKKFFIKHGFSGEFDYFSFFEQMGEVHYFIIETPKEQGEKVVGAGCAILRTINAKKVWYLGDFKLSKNYRKKGLIENMFWKFFILHYCKAQRGLLVNMSPPKNNGLIKKVLKIFKWFNIYVEELYFFEWSKKQLLESGFDLSPFQILHNTNKKDIVIDDKAYPIYHLTYKTTTKDYSLFQKIDIEHLQENDNIMWCSVKTPLVEKLLIIKNPSAIGTILTHRIDQNYFSSVEI